MFCRNCGSKMLTRVGESSWTETSICPESECRTKAHKICGDHMGGSTDSYTYSRLSEIKHKEMLDLFDKVGVDGRIPD